MSRNLHLPGSCNPSANPSFDEVSDQAQSAQGGNRRHDARRAAGLRRPRDAAAAELHADRAVERRRAARAAGVRGEGAVPLGRPGRLGRRHAAVPHGRLEQRRRPGAAGRHAPRRHALLPARGLAARAAGDEPRVHRRRPAVHRRHEDLERREGAEGAKRGRRVRHRGPPARQPMGSGAAFEVRAQDHGAHPVPHRRPGRRPSADAHRERPRRHHRPRHLQRLRARLDAVGHLPDLRGELARQLRQRRRHPARPAALPHDGARPRLPLARARRALRRRGGIRTSPTASAGWSRSIRSTRTPSR